MIVKVRLFLPKANNRLILKYKTYEKVSYDKYFISSLIKNAKEKDEIYILIDEVTGKGSLNEHFKKTYDEMKNLNQNDIEAILNESLYPVLKIQDYYFQYIPMLNISLFNNKVIQGNIVDDDLFAKTLVDKDGTYVDHEFIQSEPILKGDTYIVSLTDEKIQIEFHKKYYNIDQSDFNNIVERDEIDLKNYKGTISNEMEGSNWLQLTRSNFNNIINSKDFYYENGNHFAIYNEFVKESIIANNWGLLWVRELTYRYNESINKDICEKVAEVLMKSGKVNEFKTKSLIDILKNISRDYQQKIINYVLKRKDSKELALIGLVLIDKGYEKGWNEEAFNSFYKFKENSKHLINLYKINHKYDYSIDDLLEIYKNDKILLKRDHLSLIKNYYSDCDLLKENIQKKVGEISVSGIRQNLGKMPLDDDVKKLRKYLNNIMAHFDRNIEDKNLEQLKQFSNRVNDFYDLYKIVKNKWENYISRN